MLKFNTVLIDEATPAQLRSYAQAFLGLPVEGATDGEVLAKVRAANDGDTIYVATEPDEPDQAGAPPPKVEGAEQNVGRLQGSLGRDDPKVRILIHNEERDGVVYSRPKEVGVNGIVWLIQRGIEVDIPYRVFEALENAERIMVTHDQHGVQHEQKAKAVPYNVIARPSAAEIAEWHARTDALFVP